MGDWTHRKTDRPLSGEPPERIVIEEIPALQIRLVAEPLWKAFVGDAALYQRVDRVTVTLIAQLPFQVSHQAVLDRFDVFRL